MVMNLFNPPTLWEPGEYDVYKERGIKLRPKRSLPPSLASILDSFGVFPPYSAVIGLCTDGLPFMLDLGNPKSGSILAVGEPNSGKTQVLRTILLSASLLNHPEDLNIFIISNKAGLYADIMDFPHCEAAVNSFERAAGELVIELASISEQRRNGRERGAKMILFIDDFLSLNGLLRDYSVYLNLKSLITRGPSSGIWPVIAIDPNDVQEKRGQLLRSFGTYIFEKTDFAPQIPTTAGYISSDERFIEPSFDVIVGGRLVPITHLSA